MQTKELIKEAIEAMQMSYSPYSNFRVGAALLTSDGKVFKGCNVENAAYSVANCAERTAIFKAVSEGYKDFQAICVVGGANGVLTDYTPPCGVCRQAMAEFVEGTDFKIIVAKSVDDYKEYSLDELLLEAFYPSKLK